MTTPPDISKAEATERLLHTAIVLLFDGYCPLAVRLLIGAAWRMAREFGGRRKGTLWGAFVADQKARGTDFLDAANSAYDYLRHANTSQNWNTL